TAPVFRVCPIVQRLMPPLGAVTLTDFAALKSRDGAALIPTEPKLLILIVPSVAEVAAMLPPIVIPEVVPVAVSDTVVPLISAVVTNEFKQVAETAPVDRLCPTLPRKIPPFGAVRVIDLAALKSKVGLCTIMPPIPRTFSVIVPSV